MHGKHWRALQRQKKYWMDTAGNVWLEAGRPVWPDGVRVVIRAVFGHGGRRDAGNYAAGSAKWAMDALTECGAWPDDAQRYLQIAGLETVYRRGEWGIELEIEGAG